MFTLMNNYDQPLHLDVRIFLLINCIAKSTVRMGINKGRCYISNIFSPQVIKKNIQWIYVNTNSRGEGNIPLDTNVIDQFINLTNRFAHGIIEVIKK